MGLSEKEEVLAPGYVLHAAMIKMYAISTDTVVLKVCIKHCHQYVIIGELFSNIYLFAFYQSLFLCVLSYNRRLSLNFEISIRKKYNNGLLYT